MTGRLWTPNGSTPEKTPWYKKRWVRWTITGVAVPLAAALLLGVFTYFGGGPDVEVMQNVQIEPPAAAGVEPAPGPQVSSLSFEAIERGEHQTVNLPEDEYATYSFIVRNKGDKAVCVSGGEFVSSRALFKEFPAHHLLRIWEMPHDGHIPVPVHQPSVGVPIPVPLDFAVPPQKADSFTLWFQLDAITQSTLGVFDITGKLTLFCDDGAVTSESIELSLCAMPDPELRPKPRSEN